MMSAEGEIQKMKQEGFLTRKFRFLTVFALTGPQNGKKTVGNPGVNCVILIEHIGVLGIFAG